VLFNALMVVCMATVLASVTYTTAIRLGWL
jgi:hypothetical protein